MAQQAAFYAVFACWCIFFLSFGLRKRPSRPRESKRDHTAMLGILLEGVGYFMVWFGPLQRKQFVPAGLAMPALGWGLALLAVSIAVASVWLADAAQRRLGKQWAVGARLVEDHTLIQDSPYSLVRNPIYLAMFGMMISIGLLRTQWVVLLAASLVFIGGTYIRIHTEERLLRGAFGAVFEDYARKVPAFLPGIW